MDFGEGDYDIEAKERGKKFAKGDLLNHCSKELHYKYGVKTHHDSPFPCLVSSKVENKQVNR